MFAKQGEESGGARFFDPTPPTKLRHRPLLVHMSRDTAGCLDITDEAYSLSCSRVHWQVS